jgi:tripartite-type tricarboxylate transporter receptor subunit TctC
MSQKLSTPLRRPFLRRSLALGLATCLAPLALTLSGDVRAEASTGAQDYPDRPITLIVAFSAGGAADVVMRKVAAGLENILKSNIIVENRAGANGNIGANHVARSKADGYTLLAGFPGLTSNPSLYKEMNYDPLKDLTPIKMIATAPVVLVANPKFQPDSLSSLIEYAKAQPNSVRFGSAGQGGSGHLAGELFKLVTGVQMEHVPYKGGIFALNDAMGGQIEIVFDSVPSSRGFIEGGRLKAFAIAGEQRSTVLPDIPTFKEAGLDNYYADTWFGILAPAGTPKPIVDKLNGAITKLLGDSDFHKELENMGLVADTRTPEQFAQFMVDETEKWRKVAEASGMAAH